MEKARCSSIALKNLHELWKNSISLLHTQAIIPMVDVSSSWTLKTAGVNAISLPFYISLGFCRQYRSGNMTVSLLTWVIISHQMFLICLNHTLCWCDWCAKLSSMISHCRGDNLVNKFASLYGIYSFGWETALQRGEKFECPRPKTCLQELFH